MVLYQVAVAREHVFFLYIHVLHLGIEPYKKPSKNIL